jgi:hypothetical protein
MHAQEIDVVVADLANVYRSASQRANEATACSHNTRLPLMERLSFRRQAHDFQELADQALRMIHELTASAAA